MEKIEKVEDVRGHLFHDALHWRQVKDGDDWSRGLFHRHYSYRPYKDGRKPKLFVGPGQKLVLITHCGRALFVWRKFKSSDNQKGVNCSIFRNESRILSSELIRQAEVIAWRRWPEARLYTYINPRKIKSTNPGCCFIKAGWQRCGVTKVNKLLIFEKIKKCR